jgi:hypothetical protein
MEERGNKTIMCSVFFLDIVEYSKKSVAGQISLKDRFNSYLSAAIRDVPMTDRIILDTGDGAAINFLGDVEDALKAALSLRESLLAEDPNVEPPLLVRMGINLGPVRLVRDINGQPNIVGDGINVAQRVMGFADAAQILVSRSYYDAVSRLSPQYAGMFHYQGSRTDKHVREHEVYAIGYPGDKTTHRGVIRPAIAGQDGNPLSGLMGRAAMVWRSAATRLDILIEQLVTRFYQAGTALRVAYVGIVAVPLLLLIALLVDLARHDEVPVAPAVVNAPAVNIIQPVSAVTHVASAASAPADSAVKTKGETQAQTSTIAHSRTKVHTAATTLKPKTKKAAKRKKAKEIHGGDQTAAAKNQATVEKNAAVAATSDITDAHVFVSCREGTEVFIDGARKGRIGAKPLTIVVPPGPHTVIVSHTSGGIYTQNVQLNAGKTLHIKPSFCD